MRCNRKLSGVGFGAVSCSLFSCGSIRFTIALYELLVIVVRVVVAIENIKITENFN